MDPWIAAFFLMKFAISALGWKTDHSKSGTSQHCWQLLLTWKLKYHKWLVWHSLSDDCSLFWPVYLVLKIKKPCSGFWEMFVSFTPVWPRWEVLGSWRVQTLQEQTGASFSSQTKSFFEFINIFPSLKVFRWWDHFCFMPFQTMVMLILTTGVPTCPASSVSLPFLVKLIPVNPSCDKPLLMCFPCSSPGWILVLEGATGLAYPCLSVPAVLQVFNWGWLL